MKALLKKEMRLSASILSYLFVGFAVMTMIPGYPILCGAFFITFGIFHSFQNAREANDIVYTALLPIAKREVVKGKYQFSVAVEMCGFVLMTILTIIRMTLLSEAKIYRQNALMNANLFFLGAALLVFGLFNLVFIGGFFKTAYKLSSFFTYIVAAFLTISAAEAAHHIPGLSALNAPGFEYIGLQVTLFLTGALLYAALTFFSYKKACRRFELIDL